MLFARRSRSLWRCWDLTRRAGKGPGSAGLSSWSSQPRPGPATRQPPRTVGRTSTSRPGVTTTSTPSTTTSTVPPPTTLPAPRPRPRFDDGSLGSQRRASPAGCSAGLRSGPSSAGPSARPLRRTRTASGSSGTDAFLALAVEPGVSFAEATQYVTTLETITGLGQQAIIANNRYLYFTSGGVSYWLLWQQVGDFSELHTSQLVALAHDVLAHDPAEQPAAPPVPGPAGPPDLLRRRLHRGRPGVGLGHLSRHVAPAEDPGGVPGRFRPREPRVLRLAASSPRRRGRAPPEARDLHGQRQRRPGPAGRRCRSSLSEARRGGRPTAPGSGRHDRARPRGLQGALDRRAGDAGPAAVRGHAGDRPGLRRGGGQAPRRELLQPGHGSERSARELHGHPGDRRAWSRCDSTACTSTWRAASISPTTSPSTWIASSRQRAKRLSRLPGRAIAAACGVGLERRAQVFSFARFVYETGGRRRG